MGEAIFSGVLASGLVKPEQVSVTDVSAERLDTLGKNTAFSLPSTTARTAARAW